MKTFAVALILAICIIGSMSKPSTKSDHDELCEGIISGLLPHPDTCSKFIQCSNEIAWEQPCPYGAPCFSQETKQCTYTDKCSCKENSTE